MHREKTVAVIPGDGIGREEAPEGLRALDAMSRRFGLPFSQDQFDWGCDHCLRTGAMMPANWAEQTQNHDAIDFGAVGDRSKVPDHISVWGLLIKVRHDFDPYGNLRPVRLMPGVPSVATGAQLGTVTPPIAFAVHG